MYVCFCKGIKDSDIRDAVAQGADNLTEIQEQLGVATQCGKCVCLVNDVISNALENNNALSAPGMFYSVA